jgi:hypothetical protein
VPKENPAERVPFRNRGQMAANETISKMGMNANATAPSSARRADSRPDAAIDTTQAMVMSNRRERRITA